MEECLCVLIRLSRFVLSSSQPNNAQRQRQAIHQRAASGQVQPGECEAQRAGVRVFTVFRLREKLRQGDREKVPVGGTRLPGVSGRRARFLQRHEEASQDHENRLLAR